MPRQKDSHRSELEDEERDIGDAPFVDESDHEDEDRARASLWSDRRASFEDEDDVEADIEDIDLEALSAMEGPDFY